VADLVVPAGAAAALGEVLKGGTSISWADFTFNPWWGCHKVSAACRFCYAERDSSRWGMSIWGKNADRRMMSEGYWRTPYTKWRRLAAELGRPLRVFSASMADVFEDHPQVGDARARLFRTIEETPWLIWMLLTKRPQNIGAMVPWGSSGWPGNVWLGVSAEKQRFANERVPVLVQYPATVLFVSAGPTLGAVDLTRIPRPSVQQPHLVWDVLGKRQGVPGCWQAPMSRGVNWVITEGESGKRRGIRPSHPGWYRTLRDQCLEAGVPYQHKQNGEWIWVTDDPRFGDQDWARHPNRHRMLAFDGGWKPVGAWDGGEDPDRDWQWMRRVGVKPAGRVLEGKIWHQFPPQAQMPEATQMVEAVVDV
jgi:protein gp37